MLEIMKEPWPWYVAGPLIGIMVPIMLVFGNKSLGISSSLRHICAMCVPLEIKYFKYDWKAERWNLFFVTGIALGGFIAGHYLMATTKVNVSQQTVADLAALGVKDFSGYLPGDIFSWSNLLTGRGLVFMVFGGFLVGFGTRYANGCTSGHSITGISNLQWVSLVATVCFFIGGLIMTYIIMPYLF